MDGRRTQGKESEGIKIKKAPMGVEAYSVNQPNGLTFKALQKYEKYLQKQI